MYNLAHGTRSSLLVSTNPANTKHLSFENDLQSANDLEVYTLKIIAIAAFA